MSDPLLRMDSLLSNLDRLDEMTGEEVEQLAEALTESAHALMEEVKQGVPASRREVWRRYLQGLLQRLPSAQEKVTAARALVARQIAAENLRVQRMRDEGKGFEGRRGLFNRNA